MLRRPYINKLFFLISFAFGLPFFSVVFSNSINNSVIESAILVNLESLDKKTRRVLSQAQETSVESEIFSDLQPVEINLSLVESLSAIFQNLPGDGMDGLSHALSYLASGKENFGLSDEGILSGMKSIIKAHFQSISQKGIDIRGQFPAIASTILSSIVPQKVSIWGGYAPSWARLISKSLIEVVFDSFSAIDPSTQERIMDDNVADFMGIASQSMISATLGLMNQETLEANGFIPGIEEVDSLSKTSNETMKFDGALGKFMKFDPRKTKIIEFVAKGISDGSFGNDKITLNDNKVDRISTSVGKSSIKGALTFLNSLEGDHSLFSYEVSKVISYGLTLGAVSASNSQLDYLDLELPSLVSEKISFNLSNAAIEESLLLQNDLELHRLAESVAFGSSMGAQTASVLEKSLEYTSSWQTYDRKQLARSTSLGNANGALNAAADKIQNDPEIADNGGSTTRTEILEIAKGSAIGSLIGNVGLSIYFPTPEDRLAIINYSAEGAAFGSVSAKNLSKVEKLQGVTEEFEVEVARAVANGATFGATFETVALLESKPFEKAADKSTIDAVEASSYGSSYGAILGALDSGESDALILKQATKQGSIEGSIAGASLGAGNSSEELNEASMRSRSAIVKAVAETNTKAASSANSNLATKAIRTSTADMLLLMRKFNINPRLTNPTRIFKPNTTKDEEKDQPFTEEFPVASPI